MMRRAMIVSLLQILALTFMGPTGRGAPVVKVLRMSYTSDIATLDPPRITRAPDYPISMNLFNGLVRYRQNSDRIIIEPDLAERWEISSDGRTYTFFLRRGVKFHRDFGEMTAQDVKFSLERVTDPALRSPYAADMRQVERIDIINDYTVRLRLREPFADFLSAVLAFRPGYIVSRRAVEQYGDRFGLNPVGTGPYMLERYTPRQELTFVPHRDYFRGRPTIDRVVMQVVPEETVSVLALVKGDLDYTIIRTPPAFRQLKLYGTLAYTATPVTGVWAAVTNNKRAPLSDVRVRRALSHAINRPEVVKNVLEGMGTDDGIWSVIPPGIFGHVEAARYPYDVEKARALLASAGAGSRPLVFLVRPPNKGEAEALQGYWQRVGVQVTIVELDGPALDARVDSGDWDLYFFGPFRVSPTQFLSYLISTAQPNFYGQIDELIDAQRVATDEAKRRSILRQIQLRVGLDLPIIPLYRASLVTAYRKGVVTGDVPNTHYWLFFWELMDVRR